MEQTAESSQTTDIIDRMASSSQADTSETSNVDESGNLKPNMIDVLDVDGAAEQSPSQHGDEDKDEEEGSNLIDPGVNQPLLKKKKNKKRKPKSKRGLNAPSGFEEYYVDTPLTPAEHEEEQQLYNKDIPIIERILTAIQRFERTRRLTSDRRDVFYKYLAYGGIDVGPNMFQSLDPKSTKYTDLDKTQLAAAMAQTSISSDKHDLNTPTSLYTVDFYGCLAGFLSRRAMEWFGTETCDQVSLITTTLERFMSYLLQHDVCPEYTSSVLAARNLTRTAASELWSISESHRWLPGDFNVACSTLFNGQYARDYDGITNWAAPDDEKARDNKPVFIGLTQETANQIMSFGIAGAAEEDVYQDFLARVNDYSIEVLEIRERAGFEITSIEPPSKECKKLYRGRSSEFRPVGQVHAKPWRNAEAPPEDLTKEEREALAASQGTNPKSESEEEIYTFLIEEIVQRHLFVGMKLEATLHRLNCGGDNHKATKSIRNKKGSGSLWFFDSLISIFCSFDMYLPNELMVGWKKPRMMPGKVGVRWFEGMGDREEQDGLIVEDDEMEPGEGEGDGGNGDGWREA